MMKLLQSIVLMLIFAATSGAQTRAIEFSDFFQMGRVTEPQISPDGRYVAYTITVYNIEKNEGNADIFIVSTDGKERRQLTFSEKKDNSPRWSANGKSVAFLSNRDGSSQIYIIPSGGGEAQKMTDIATEVKSFAWSPDGKYFAIATDMYPESTTPEESKKIDEAKETDLANGKIFDQLMYRHWNEWRDGKYSRVLIVPVDGGDLVSVTPSEKDTPPISLGSDHDFVWAPDSHELCFVSNPDPVVAISTNNDLWLTDRSQTYRQQITSGKGNDMGPLFSPNGEYIAYMSMARAGFESDQTDLKVYDLNSDKAENLTETLDLYVSDFAWSPKSNRLYFRSPYHGYHRVYMTDLKSKKRELLLDRHNVVSLTVSPDEKFLVLAIQAINQPTELYRFDIGNKKLTQLSFTNNAKLAELEMNNFEEHWFMGAKNDSIQLLMLKPPHFDSSKKYPLISLVHGGPQGAWEDEFHYRWNAQMFAAPGYVVIMINFHGSRGFGQAFCDAVSKDWGGAPYEDVMTGTKWASEKFPFIDPKRVGAAGASYGGFMLNWIEGHNQNGLFKVMVSHDGVYEQVGMFGATEELWFPIWEFNGYPWEEGSLYQKWNPANYVDNFRTPMLVIHGQNDFRIPYTQAMQLFTALQIKGVDSRFLFFPDETHFVLKPQNAQLWWKTVYEWLGKYLKP
jgi:dipeptidyl aminopeptidase/acylaminoacyl peptidase